MWRHCLEKHKGEVKVFRMDVLDTFKRNPMLRQVTEAVRICHTKKEELINRKEEYRSTQQRWRQRFKKKRQIYKERCNKLI